MLDKYITLCEITQLYKQIYNAIINIYVLENDTNKTIL